MTTASGKQLPMGFRFGYIFELNANGRPKATGVTPYEGIPFYGSQAFTLNFPEAQRITHYGEDRTLASAFLASKDPVIGELRSAVDNLDLDAVLSGNKKFEVGEAAMLAAQTDNQGNEPVVGGLFYQKSLDLTSKRARWRTFLIPSMIVQPIPSGFAEGVESARYPIICNPSGAHLWGTPMTLNTEGALEAAVFRGMTEGKPKLVAFLGDGTTLAFPLPANAPALSTDKIVVVKNGAEVTSGITLATTGVTFAVAPALNDDIDIFYEH